MDPRVMKLQTQRDCEVFAKNARDRGMDELAEQARARRLQVLAAGHSPTTDAEREALEAVYAYEAIMSDKRGKKTSASRTWPMIKQHGVIGAVERVVNRKDASTAYHELVEGGLGDFSFESVVVRHPDLFTTETLARSKERLAEPLTQGK